MKRTLLMMTLSLIALAALPGCKITSGGYYAGSGIYDDGYSYGGSSDWGSSNDHWDHGSSGGSSNSDRERERDAYDRQEHNGGGGLTPPDRKIGPNMVVMSLGSNTRPQSGFQSTDSRVIQVANKYAITHYAATYIVRAVELAKVDDESGIKDLGLSKKDFQKVLKGKLSDEKVEILGAKLLMPTEDVEQLIGRIKNDIEYANQ